MIRPPEHVTKDVSSRAASTAKDFSNAQYAHERLLGSSPSARLGMTFSVFNENRATPSQLNRR